MTMWPTVLGFLVLMALVVAMGTQSTRRYEQEQRAERTTGPRAVSTRTTCRPSE